MATAHPTTKAARVHMLSSIAVIVAALYFAKEVLIPLALAVMLAFLLAPLVTRLQRYGLPRIPALIVVVLALVGVLGGLGFVVAGQLRDVADGLPKYKANIEEKATWLRQFTSSGTIDKAAKVIKDAAANATTQPTTTAPTANATSQPTAVIRDLPGAGGAAEKGLVPTKSGEAIPVVITNRTPEDAAGANAFKNLFASLSPLLEPIGTAGIVLIFVIFMLLGREDLRDRVIRLIGQGRINVTTQAMDEAATKISRYLIAQCIVNGTYGIAISLGLWLIGLTLGGNDPGFPNWLLWGMLTAVLRFIPYIGPWIGAAFPIVLSLAVYHGMAVPIAVIGMFLVIELLSNNIMEPWLYGTSTGVSTLAILISAVFWTWLWGTPGLLLATPLTVLIAVTGKYVPQLEFLNILLGDEPALEPKYRFYQRLLAEDVEEADDLLAEYLKERSVVDVYDRVVLPAMRLAEDDWHNDRLDERKQGVVRRAIRELVDEVGEKPRKVSDAEADAATSTEGLAAAASGAAAGAAAGKYDRCVLCLPARDPADEIGAMMVAQILEHEGFCAEYMSVDRLASEYVELVEKRGVQVVIISALPPGAATHARYLVKRLRLRFPELKIIVGLWTVEGDLARAKERLGAAGTTLVVSSIEAAVEQLQQVVQPLLVTAAAAAAADDEPVGAR
jgi:predicted PurR-regulated permease PerM/methylmalonyl-CoA mutase cobalamin-binding subunit